MHRSSALRPLALALLVMGAAACQSTTQPEAPQQATAEAPPAITLPPPATPAEKEQAILGYAQMQLMKSFDKRCNWLGDIERSALDASLNERKAWMQWQQMDMKQAVDKTAELASKNAGIACDSAEGQQHRSGIQFGVWQMRSSWAMRGYSLLPGDDQPGWYAGKSNVNQHRAALDAAIAGLKHISAESIEISLGAFRAQASALLAVRCKAQDRQQCPVLKADAGYRAYAEQVLVQTEAYAAALENVQDKTGVPPK